MKKLRRVLGLESWDERMARLPRAMSVDEKADVIKIIEGFINKTGGPYDWDWILTGPKKSQEAELIEWFCTSLDFVYPPEKKGHFCNSVGIEKLAALLELLKNQESGSPRVFEFLEEFKRKAEQIGRGNE